jgi:hypothetical protein
MTVKLEHKHKEKSLAEQTRNLLEENWKLSSFSFISFSLDVTVLYISIISNKLQSRSFFEISLYFVVNFLKQIFKSFYTEKLTSSHKNFVVSLNKLAKSLLAFWVNVFLENICYSNWFERIFIELKKNLENFLLRSWKNF